MSTRVTPKRKAPVKKSAAKKTAPVRKAAGSKTTPARKKPAAKKAPAKKAAAPTRRGAAKKAAPARKAAAKKTSTGSGRGGFHRELDDTGLFVVGTDSSTIAEYLLNGGADRADINDQVLEAIGGETRNGTERNVPALVSGVLNKMLEAGYTVESTFVVNPPTAASKRKASRKK